MTTTRLGVLAFSVLGVWVIAQAAIAGVITSVSGSGTQPTGMFFTLLAVQLLIGIVLVRFRFAIANRLFDEDEDEVGRMSALDAQVAGLAMLGVWLAVEHLPALLQAVVIQPSKIQAETRLGIILASVLGLGLGTFLVLRGEVLARLWCPREESSS